MMRNLLVTAVAALLLASCGKHEGAATEGMHAASGDGGAGTTAQRAPVAGALPPGTLRLQRVEIVDQGGFERPMVASTALIPVGWRAQGGIVWGALGQCGFADYTLNWSATAPDGVTAFARFPAATWSSTRTNLPIENKSPCEQAEYASAREFLEAFARRNYAQVRILDYRPTPEVAKPLRDLFDQLGSINSDTMQSQVIVDAGELLISHAINGREVRESLSTVVTITRTRYADLINPGQVGMETLQGVPDLVTMSRAPAGQLDFRLQPAILKSFRSDPAWSAKIAAFQAKKNATNRKAMDEGHRLRMEALGVTSAIINGTYEDRQLVDDRIQRERIEAIRGVETYNDPVAGRPVQLDNTFDHAWRVSDGTYVLTNDPSFDPGLYGLQGQPLEVMR